MTKKTVKQKEAAFDKMNATESEKGKYSAAKIPQDTEKSVKQKQEKRKKKMFSLRLSLDTIEWWKTTYGKGYTGIMAHFLEEAKNHPDLIKKHL